MVPCVGHRFLSVRFERSEAGSDGRAGTSLKEPCRRAFLIAGAPVRQSRRSEQDIFVDGMVEAKNHFADGMVEDIVTALSRHALAVRHRAEFDLHLEGPGGRREAGRGESWGGRPLCAPKAVCASDGNWVRIAGQLHPVHRRAAHLMGSTVLMVDLANVFDLQDRGDCQCGVGGPSHPSWKKRRSNGPKRKPTEKPRRLLTIFCAGMAATSIGGQGKANDEAPSVASIRLFDLDPQFRCRLHGYRWRTK